MIAIIGASAPNRRRIPLIGILPSKLEESLEILRFGRLVFAAQGRSCMVKTASDYPEGRCANDGHSEEAYEEQRY